MEILWDFGDRGLALMDLLPHNTNDNAETHVTCH